jgi:hypothetical protein
MLPLHGLCYFHWRQQVEHIQRKFLNLCHRFFPQIHHSYASALDHLDFHSLCSRRCHLDELFLVNFYNDFKCCPFLLEPVGIYIAIWNVRLFLCSLLFPHIKVFPLLDMHQPQIPFVKIFIFMKQPVILNHILM